MSQANGRHMATWAAIYEAQRMSIPRDQWPMTVRSDFLVRWLVEKNRMPASWTSNLVRVQVDERGNLVLPPDPDLLIQFGKALKRCKGDIENAKCELSFEMQAPKARTASNHARAVGLRLYDLVTLGKLTLPQAVERLQAELTGLQGPGKAAMQVIIDRGEKSLYDLCSVARGSIQAGRALPVGKNKSSP
ncbi:hypothetical protein [Desulfolutivibrio sulfoxidireducens]|uniref:hypothetical protein n=1 Tax=Desulfolutivibrio sulfoxidireducens TaxID=2773299 RepID=UPI00159DD1CD|nr:hypothetical protein [Desulfolutivibrio sulfoxidireducens]QLA21251.1 hypothetical protein GD604_16730 [Desulfolutivibrio sulfoxidireducens]